MRAWRAMGLASTALAVSGCTLLVPTTDPVANTCTVPSDCTDGTRCDDSNRCVRDDTDGERLVLRIADGETVVEVPVSPGQTEVVLPRPVPVLGTVRFAGRTVRAEVSFRARPMPEAAVLAGEVRVPTAAGAGPDVSVDLPGGRMYDVLVEPVSDDRSRLPPLRASLEVLEGVGASFGVDYDSVELSTFAGRVLDSSGRPQANVEVRGIDASGRVVSTRSLTGETGDFELLSSGPMTSLRVLPVDASAGVPTLTVPLEVLMPDADGRVRVLVPSSENAMRVMAQVEDSTGAPAGHALVRFVAPNLRDPATGITGSLVVDWTADAGGRLTGWLLPGTYRVEIVPPEGSAGVLVESLEVASNPTGMLIGQLFVLPPRVVVFGSVRVPSGTPVPSAVVRAVALGEPIPGVQAAFLNRTATTRTTASGDFVLPLDEGRYDLRVEMEAASAFPWGYRPNLAVVNGGLTIPTIEVAAPAIRRVRIVYSDRAAVADAPVDAALASDSRVRDFGSARTNTDGVVELLVPSL